MAGFKQYQDIEYSSWSLERIDLIMDPNLVEACSAEVPEIPTEELLAIREAGMVVASGAKAGTMRNPQTTYKLWGVNDSMVGQLPWLAQVMLTQIWCAHPASRNKYMILDPKNWDFMPKPLIDTQITKVVPSVKSFIPKKPANSEWDAHSL